MESLNSRATFWWWLLWDWRLGFRCRRLRDALTTANAYNIVKYPSVSSSSLNAPKMSTFGLVFAIVIAFVSCFRCLTWEMFPGSTLLKVFELSWRYHSFLWFYFYKRHRKMVIGVAQCNRNLPSTLVVSNGAGPTALLLSSVMFQKSGSSSSPARSISCNKMDERVHKSVELHTINHRWNWARVQDGIFAG